MNRIFFVVLSVILFSCDNTRVFEDNYVLNEAYWHVDSIAEFSFDINEVNKTYDLSFNLRNTSAYPYYNLYLKYDVTDSMGNELFSGLENLILFDQKTGEPLGSGLGDVFDHQMTLLENYEFDMPGVYSISFQQFMRIDSLPMIHYVGARVAVSND